MKSRIVEYATFWNVSGDQVGTSFTLDDGETLRLTTRHSDQLRLWLEILRPGSAMYYRHAGKEGFCTT